MKGFKNWSLSPSLHCSISSPAKADAIRNDINRHATETRTGKEEVRLIRETIGDFESIVDVDLSVFWVTRLGDPQD